MENQSENISQEMLHNKKILYPIGQQSFEELRDRECLYVDKTQFIEKILRSGTQYYFLGRPRRFGKSLFLSTLKCFFEAKRHLFTGLYADKMCWEWEPWPVIHLDLNRGEYTDSAEELETLINNFLTEHERKYGISASTDSVALRFENIIKAARENTGKNVVILVDEYDKPLVNNINNPDVFEKNRTILARLYSNFKSSADYIRLVFMTGISQFGKLSVFSGLNNISDISFDEEFSAICGITDQELTDNFQVGIASLGKSNDLSYEETLSQLKFYYDGYHFGKRCPDIYNPFSLLNVMQKKDFYCYWVQSGTPNLLANALKKERYNLNDVLHCRATRLNLSTLDINALDIKSLLFQTGYLTIKSYDKRRDDFLLGLPNEEVKRGFLEFLLPYYTGIKKGQVNSLIFDLIDDFEDGQPDMAMSRIQTLFANYSNRLGFGNEENVRNAMLILIDLIGIEVKAELETSDGRIDLLVETKEYIYIIELKFNGSSQEAIDQINHKHYTRPYQLDSRRIFKIGANFSPTSRTLSDDWIIE